MSFLKFVVKNPFRRKTSAILSIIGICIGLTIIVALGGITEGLIAEFDDTVHAHGADFTVTGKESGNSAYGTDTISSNWTDKIASVDGVNEVFPIYVALVTAGNAQYTSLIGINPQGASVADLSITDGRIYKDDTNEVVIGKIYAENNNISVGDNLNINNNDFDVVGIYETGNQGEDGGIYTSIKTVGKLMNDKDKISNIYVKVDKGADVKTVADRIDSKYGDKVVTVTSIMEMDQMASMIDMLKGTSWGISLLAIVVGGLGIINTMVMSVFERTRELGVLKSVGWTNKRIIEMIVGESLVLTVISAILASILGVGLTEMLHPYMGINPIFTPDIFMQTFVVAIVVGVLGGLYPAIKAIKLPPTEALRYE